MDFLKEVNNLLQQTNNLQIEKSVYGKLSSSTTVLMNKLINAILLER
jgi:hypothetical protein